MKEVTVRMYIKDYFEGEVTTTERAELNSECDYFKQYKDAHCEANIKGKDAELVLTVKNVDKLSEDEIYDMDLDDFTDYTYEELKKEATEDGYTCK